VAFVVHARAWEFLCDDAFISFRYAKNLAELGVLELNPGERVEGYTNFLWVVVLAALHAVGVAPPRGASVLTGMGALAGLVAAVLVARVLRRRLGGRGVEGAAPTPADDRLRALDLVPVALLVSLPEHMVWAHGGLETSWAAALSLGAIGAWSAGRLRLAAGLCAAAALMRPDALVPVAAFGLAWLAVVGGPVLARERWAALARLPRRRLAAALLVLVVPLLVHLAWRRSYYGAWLPNTWFIKAHGALLRDTYGHDYVRAWLEALPLVYVVPLAVLLRPRHLLLVLPIAAVVAYGWSVGGDFMAYGRFYVAATGLFAALVGWLLADGARLLSRVAPPRVAVALPVLVGVLLAAATGVRAHARWQDDVARPTGWLDGKWEGVAAMDRFARVGLAVGEWMHDNLPPDTLVSVGAAGAVPYGAGLPIVDAYGLVDPGLARLPGLRPHQGPGARPGHQIIAPVSYIKARDPDLLCHVGFRGDRPPSERRAHPAFRAGYVWACIEPPPVPDPRAEGGWLDPGVYCCRRPRDRVVGPFGRAR
jgi:arabinofuranosyltransferase